MKPSNEPDTLPWNGPIPIELNVALYDDFPDIVNHLISLGLHHKVGLLGHRRFYLIREGEQVSEKVGEDYITKEGESLVPVPPERTLVSLARDWFHAHYPYQTHWLDSAACFAMARISGWRRLGGDTASLPRQHRPIIFLNNDMFSIEPLHGEWFRMSIKMFPRKPPISMDIHVVHRHSTHWLSRHQGSLVIVPGGFRFTATNPAPVPGPPSSNTAAFDTNMSRVVFSRSDGKHLEADISDVLDIQKNHRETRESVQRTNARNPAKGERIMARQKEREHHRVEDRLHKLIHGKDSTIAPFIKDFHLGREDLRRTTQDTIKLDSGKRMRARKSSWIHGLFDTIIAHHHPDNELYYTRGTSQYCPFDGSELTHPVWKQSSCLICGRLYDRDHLETDAGLVRTIIHQKYGRKPYKLVKDVLPETAKALQELSTIRVLRHDEPGPPAPPFERGLKGLSVTVSTLDERSVHPDSRSLLPGAQSDTDSDRKVEVVHVNRSDAFDEVGHATVDGRTSVKRDIRSRKSRYNAILTGA